MPEFFQGIFRNFNISKMPFPVITGSKLKNLDNKIIAKKFDFSCPVLVV